MTAKSANEKHNDNMLKVIALICAVLLWFYAEAQENPSKERQLPVPVQYVNLASDYVVENASQTVQITVKGNETDIMSLRSDDFVAVVDLSGAIVGSAAYPVQVTSTAVTDRFTYTPDKINLSVDRMLQKEVPIRVRTDGALPQYYELQHIDVQPDTAIIRGKSKVLDAITGIDTAIIDISALKQDCEVETMMNLPDGVTAQMEDGSFAAEAGLIVAIHVQPIQSSKTLETVIALRDVADGLTGTLDVDKAVMLLEGDAELLAKQPILDQLLLHVDCSGLTAGVYTLPIRVESSNVAVYETLQSIIPQTVTVILTNGDVPLSGDSGERDENHTNNEIEDKTNGAE